MQPLLDRTVVVTRARDQAAALAEPLAALGAEPVLFPTIRIAPPADPAPLRAAVHALDSYEWVIFTSANGVERLCRELAAAGRDTRALDDVHVACIGPATAAALERRGIHPAVMPDAFVAEALLEALTAEEMRRRKGGARRAGSRPLNGVRVLLPRAAGARSVLPNGLAERGADVHTVEAYRAVPASEDVAALRRRLDTGAVDAITFTASSTVRHFVAAVGAEVGRAAVAAIGPITAATARDCGLDVQVVAREYTIPGLVAALVRHFARSPVSDGGV